jgi:exodeoxyribonuclease VII large subunit
MAMTASIDRLGADVAHIGARLVALSPAATLRRGYAIVQQADGGVVTTAAQVSDGDLLTVRFAGDQLPVTAGHHLAGH